MTPKLAIALQCWEGDIYLGQRLARLICSVEPMERHDIEVIVSTRRGTNLYATQQLADILRKTFPKTQVILGKRFGENWPSGCNDLWAETMMRVSQFAAMGSIQSTGVLTFEADCIPLRPDWLDVLAEEWRLARLDGKHCCGHAHGWVNGQTGEIIPPTHINGNAIFDVRMTKLHPEMNGSDSKQGWDAFHGKTLLACGRDTFSIYQKYRIPDVTRADVEGFRKFGQIPALFHGIKKTSGLEAVESMVADGSFFTRHMTPVGPTMADLEIIASQIRNTESVMVDGVPVVTVESVLPSDPVQRDAFIKAVDSAVLSLHPPISSSPPKPQPSKLLKVAKDKTA